METVTSSHQSVVKHWFSVLAPTVVVVGGALFLSSGMSDEMPGLAPAPSFDFVQITSTRLDAGVQTFEAFRILRNGRAEWARWNSSGVLLDHAEPTDMGSDAFDRVVTSPAFLRPPEPRGEAGILGRPGYRLEISTLTKSGVDTVFLNEMPDDIAVLTERLEHQLAATPVKRGWYVWTKPYPRQDTADIDFTEAGCDSAVATALREAVRSGRLVVPADDGIRVFRSGERANRVAFAARLAAGDLHFGVLFAK